MLGADTRSTSDTTVADKNCEKIHFIAPNIYCCGAGTAADTENVTGAALFSAADWPGASVDSCRVLMGDASLLQEWCRPRWSCTGMRRTGSRGWSLR